jgi:hypothetical protein
VAPDRDEPVALVDVDDLIVTEPSRPVIVTVELAKVVAGRVEADESKQVGGGLAPDCGSLKPAVDSELDRPVQFGHVLNLAVAARLTGVSRGDV